MTTRRSRANRTAARGKVHFYIGPMLTSAEIRELKQRAKSELRTVGNYVAHLVAKDLKRSSRRRAPLNAGSGKREVFKVGLTLTLAQRRKLEVRARAEHRSVGNYVAAVIVEALGRG